MSSNELELDLLPRERQRLLDVAASSIQWGLEHDSPLDVVVEQHSPELQVLRATFVTLRINGKLRGCMGALSATVALVADVARNAFTAAFHDLRFSGLTTPEFDELDIHVSILSTPEAVAIRSESDLLEQMRPGIDGLILYEGSRKGTLLPSVWESTPDPREFLVLLKGKAGLKADYWSNSIRIERYVTTSFGK